MTPEGWTETRFGNAFAKRAERGKAGLPTMSVTINDGLVFRDSIDRKMDTNLLAEEHLLVRKGDIAYNMMRMWQGASGLAEADALVSPAYVVLRPTAAIDPLFAAYLFKHPRTIYLFWAYSHGLTEDRLRLYFDDFSLIPICLPPIPEQQKIAEILTAWDHAIVKVEALIANARAKKQALIQRLLPIDGPAPKARLAGFSGEWAKTTLGERGGFRKGKGGSRSDAKAQGIPCIRYGEIYTHHHDVVHVFNSFIDEAAAMQSERLRQGDILFACSGETAEEIGKCVAFTAAHEAYAGGDIVIFTPEQDDPVFLAYMLNSSPVAVQKAQFGQGNSVVHISATNLAKLRISLPLKAEQKAIGALFLAADRGILSLTAQLASLREEKSALMQQLLTGKRRVKVEKREIA
jgi:type I restriction enzyme S subunit